MAYNKRNRYLRIVEIQDITLRKQAEGLTNVNIHKLHIYPKYHISLRTFYEYLATPAKRELKKIEEQTNLFNDNQIDMFNEKDND